MPEGMRQLSDHLLHPVLGKRRVITAWSATKCKEYPLGVAWPRHAVPAQPAIQSPFDRDQTLRLPFPRTFRKQLPCYSSRSVVRSFTSTPNRIWRRKWSPRRDSNPRPLPYQGRGLPRTPRWAHFEFRRTAFLGKLVPWTSSYDSIPVLPAADPGGSAHLFPSRY